MEIKTENTPKSKVMPVATPTLQTSLFENTKTCIGVTKIFSVYPYLKTCIGMTKVRVTNMMVGIIERCRRHKKKIEVFMS